MIKTIKQDLQDESRIIENKINKNQTVENEIVENNIIQNKIVERKNFKKIDIHCHTSRRLIPSAKRQDASLGTIIQEMQEWNIEKTVLLATYFPTKQSGITNYRLASWIKDKPEFCMFGSLDLPSYFYQGYNELEELAESNSIKGIKLYPGYQAIDPLNKDHKEKLLKFGLLAKKYDLPLMIHTGDCHNEPHDLAPNPKTFACIGRETDCSIIFSHLGNGHLSDLLYVLKSVENTYTDTSGICDEYHERPQTLYSASQQVKKVLDEVGTERVFFGTDFPVQTHLESVLLIEEAMKNFSIEDKQNVYYNNARRLLKC